MSILDASVSELLNRMCVEVNTPRALSVAICLRYGAVEVLQSFKTEPCHYQDSQSYHLDNMVTTFLKKWRDPSSSKRLAMAAQDRFLLTEQQCCATNVRMSRHLDNGPFSDQQDLRVHEFLARVRRRISSILGPIPTNLNGGRFGPGATLTNPGALSTIPDKLESVPVGTKSAMYIFDTLFSECAWVRYSHNSWSQQDLRSTVRSSRFFTVPKNHEYDRGACLSPNVNGFLQLAVGDHIRKRLTRVGINIKQGDDGRVLTPDLHRRLARSASIDGSLATIDLQDASNTISRNLVRLLLGDWVGLLDSLREPTVELLDGRTLFLEMYSAMGNGYTFELETLIFYAICKEVVGDGFVSVFGDDIIVPTSSASDVIAVLRYCGFVTNVQKTFTTGPFRESCGGDYFDGKPVRGYYLKKSPSGPQDWISIANGLRGVFGEHFSRFSSIWQYALQQIPSAIRRCRGPEALGDIVIHDPAWRPHVEKHSIRYWLGYKPVPFVLSLHHWSPQVVLASALYGVPSSGVSPRKQTHMVTGFRCSLVPYS